MTIRAFTILALVVALLAAPAAASARVPQGFFGVNLDGPALGQDFNSEFGTMVGSGVESVRTDFLWIGAQWFRTWSDVPPPLRSQYENVGGVPTNWSATDRIVRAAALRRLRVLPVVIGAPHWDTSDPNHDFPVPSDPQPYANFLAALAHRYGTHGSFWRQNPRLPRVPIRDWQVWNEPHFTIFWSQQPFAAPYVALLRASYRALHRADRHARLVLAGLTSYSWRNLAQVYRAGGRRWFDVVAIHPFSQQLYNVLKIVRLSRKVMRNFHDGRKPIFITETSWPSATGKVVDPHFEYDFQVTERQQAARVRAALRAYAAVRRSLNIQRVFWYTWMSNDSDRTYPFDYAGLLRFTGFRATPKPALAAFRRQALRLEGCRAKVGVATRCRR